MKFRKLHIFHITLWLLFQITTFSQEIPTLIWNKNGSVTVIGEKEFIYTTPFVLTNDDPIIADSELYLNPRKIALLKKQFGKIEVSNIINPTSLSSTDLTSPPVEINGVTVQMMQYLTKSNSPSQLVYGAYESINNNSSNIPSSWRYVPIEELEQRYPEIRSNQISKMVRAHHPQILNYSEFTKLSKSTNRIPIVIKVKVKNATLHSITIPAVGTFTPKQLVTPEVIVTITSFPDQTTKVLEFREGENFEIVNAKLGDEVRFEVQSNERPIIKNLPATWLAATGREYIYHCDPNVQPGALKPAIPFDIQDYFISSNEIPQNNTYPDWQTNSNTNTTQILNWKVQRLTNANLTTYHPLYKYQKVAEHHGKMQRKNKSEGQMMEFLRILAFGTNNFTRNTYQFNNDTAPKYFWNLYADDLLFLTTNQQDNNSFGTIEHTIKRTPNLKLTDQPFPITTGNRITESFLFSNSNTSVPSLDISEIKNHLGSLYEPWQVVREGDYTWGSDGYPLSGFVVNDLVNTYWKVKNINSHTYKGYEIEDTHMYKNKFSNWVSAANSQALIDKDVIFSNAYNISNDNNKHPGTVTIITNNKAVKIAMNITSPLAVDKGFYGNIEVPEFSAVRSNQVLKVTGLPTQMNLNTLPQQGYELKIRSYNFQDFEYQVFNIKTDGSYNEVNGTWEIEFTTDDNQGQSATLYYNDVIISGSEWKNSNFNHLYCKTAVDSRTGEIDNSFLNLKSQNDVNKHNFTQEKRYASDALLGFVNNYDENVYWKSYTNQFVLDKNCPQHKILLSSLDALENIWGNDPYTSFKGYRSLAKRVTDDVIKKNLIYVLLGPSGSIETTTDQRDYVFDFKNRDVGLYKLYVFSKSAQNSVEHFNLQTALQNIHENGFGNPNSMIELKVVNHDKEFVSRDGESALGLINTRLLTDYERKFLNLEGKEFDNYRIASVDDLLSTHLYNHPLYRANSAGEKPHKFAQHNDFNDSFVWTTINHFSNDKKVNNPIEEVLPSIPLNILHTNDQTFSSYLSNTFDPKSLWPVQWNNHIIQSASSNYSTEDITINSKQFKDNDVRDLLDNLFAKDPSQDPYNVNSFLRKIISVTPTPFEGYLINGMMTTIVNIPEFFNTIAFNGLSKPPVQRPHKHFIPVLESEFDMTDENKNKEQLFRKLKNGSLIVYNPDLVKNFTVYNVAHDYNSSSNPDKKIFVATTLSNSPITLMIGNDLKSITNYATFLKNKDSDLAPYFPTPKAVTSSLNLYGLLTNSYLPPYIPQNRDCPTSLTESYGGLGEDPTGNKHYNYIKNTSGTLDIDPYNKGKGITDTRLLADTFPTSDLNIGLEISNIENSCGDQLANLKDIQKGIYDKEIDRLIQFCNSRSSQKIYLRIGYAYNLVWNPVYYDTQSYVGAYRYIVNRMKNKVSNVLYVWQANSSPHNYVDYLAIKNGDLNLKPPDKDNQYLIDPSLYANWYPGNEYVDIIGLTWHENPNLKSTIESAGATNYKALSKTQLELADLLLNYARTANKPVMIAEATPRGYNISKLTRNNSNQFWDGQIWTNWPQEVQNNLIHKNAHPKQPIEIWNEFYQPLFRYIDLNSDIIKYFNYANTNWEDRDLSTFNTENQYWGDSRIEANQLIAQLWMNEISKPKWIHGVATTKYPTVTVFKTKEICKNKVELEWKINGQIVGYDTRLEVFEAEKPIVNNSTATTDKIGTLVFDNAKNIVQQDGQDLYIILDINGKPISQDPTCDVTTKADCNLINATTSYNLIIYKPAIDPITRNPITFNFNRFLENNLHTQKIQGLKADTQYKASLSFFDQNGNTIGLPLATYFRTDQSCSPEEDIPPSIPITKNPNNPIFGDFTLFPNPTKSDIFIRFTINKSTDVHIIVIDLAGKIIFEESSYRNKGYQEFKLTNLKQNIDKGVLVVKIVAGNEVISKKIAIE